jgi:replicative DNA helicase
VDPLKFSHQLANELSAVGAFILSHDSEAQAAVEMRLGMMDTLKPQMLCDREIREIWAVLVELTLLGQSPDAVLIASKLRTRKGVNPDVAIERLAQALADTPVWQNGLEYARNVADFWKRRTISEALGKVVSEIQGLDPTKKFDPMDALNKAFRAICESADGPTVALLMSFLDEAMSMKFTTEKPIVTRIAKLDGNINLFTPGELTILAARPSIGKSSLARQICANASAKGDIMIFSMEVSPQILSLQFACEMAGIPMSTYTKGQATQDQVLSVMQQMEDPNLKRLHVYTQPQASAMDVAMALTNLKVKGREVAAVVIDYLGLMSHPKAERHDISVGATTRALKQIAIQRNVPIILLCQLNREVEKRGGSSELDRPRLADLRDSGNIEQDADNVLFLWRKERDDEYKPIEARTLTVAKHRNGQVFEIDLMFDKARARFYETSTVQDDAEDWRTK